MSDKYLNSLACEMDDNVWLRDRSKAAHINASRAYTEHERDLWLNLAVSLDALVAHRWGVACDHLRKMGIEIPEAEA